MSHDFGRVTVEVTEDMVRQYIMDSPIVLEMFINEVLDREPEIADEIIQANRVDFDDYVLCRWDGGY